MWRIIRFLTLLMIAMAPAAATEQGATTTSRYAARDFSTLLKPGSEFIGYIGTDFQRLKIHFTEVRRDSANPKLYRVRGLTLVKNTACDFTGTIVIDKISAQAPFTYTPEDVPPVTVKARGHLAAHYEFRENPEQTHAGIFTGTMWLDWVIDAQGSLVRDEIDIVSDGYANNQYTGWWTAYPGRLVKKANWGEYRVPDSDGLDCGAAEFAPCEHYRDKGWADYTWQKWKD